jgi:hypothetical protein
VVTAYAWAVGRLEPTSLDLLFPRLCPGSPCQRSHTGDVCLARLLGRHAKAASSSPFKPVRNARLTGAPSTIYESGPMKAILARHPSIA